MEKMSRFLIPICRYILVRGSKSSVTWDVTRVASYTIVLSMQFEEQKFIPITTLCTEMNPGILGEMDFDACYLSLLLLQLQ